MSGVNFIFVPITTKCHKTPNVLYAVGISLSRRL
jgi:hypothetical protein